MNLQVSRSGPHSARIVQRGIAVIEVLPQDAAGRDALQVAQAWAKDIELIVQSRKQEGKVSTMLQNRTNPLQPFTQSRQ